MSLHFLFHLLKSVTFNYYETRPKFDLFIFMWYWFVFGTKINQFSNIMSLTRTCQVLPYKFIVLIYYFIKLGMVIQIIQICKYDNLYDD